MSAQREMLSDELVEVMENLHQYPRLIAERAAHEAVQAALDALRVEVGPGVEGLPKRSVRPSLNMNGDPLPAGRMVDVAAVIGLIDAAIDRARG